MRAYRSFERTCAKSRAGRSIQTLHTVFMEPQANQFGLLQAHRSAAPVFIGSLRSVTEGRRSMRVSGRFAVAAQVRLLPRAQLAVATPFRLACVRAATRPASARAQRRSAPTVMRFAQALSRHPRPFSAVLASRFVLQSHTEKPAPSSSQCSNPALNLAPFSRWTLRDKAAQRRLALR